MEVVDANHANEITDGTPDTETEEKTAYELWQEKVKSVRTRLGASCMTVRGIKRIEQDDDDDDDDEEEEDDDNDNNDDKNYTEEQLDHVRLIMMTDARIKMFEHMSQLVLGDQYDRDFMMFDTRFSYEVVDAFEILKRKMRNMTGARSSKVKFDMILGFTAEIDKYDVWMHDHEYCWDGAKMIKSLARMWKNTLKKSNEELGIDSDFTRPGVICLLEEFKKKVEDIDEGDEPPLKFIFM
jgi:hypothetical protein